MYVHSIMYPEHVTIISQYICTYVRTYMQDKAPYMQYTVQYDLRVASKQQNKTGIISLLLVVRMYVRTYIHLLDI